MKSSSVSGLVALSLVLSAGAANHLAPHDRHRARGNSDLTRIHRVVKRQDLLSGVISDAASTPAASTAAASTDEATTTPAAAASTTAAAVTSAATTTTSPAAASTTATPDSSSAAASTAAASSSSSSSTDSSSTSATDASSSGSATSFSSSVVPGSSSASGSISGSSSGTITSSGSQASSAATKTKTSSSSVDTSTLTGSALASASAAAVKSAAAKKSSTIKKGVIIAIASAGGGALLLYLIWTIVRKTKFSTSRKFEDRLAPVAFIGGDDHNSFEREEHDAIVDHAGGTGRSAYAPSVARSDSGGKYSNFGGNNMSEYGHGLPYQPSAFSGREPAAMGYADLQRGNSQATTLGANLQRGQSGLSNGAGIERSYSPYNYEAHSAAQKSGRY